MTVGELEQRMDYLELKKWKRFMVQFKFLARPTDETNEKPVDEMTEEERTARVRAYNAMRSQDLW